MSLISSKLNIGLQLFCPRRHCSYYQFLDNKIIKDGKYKTKHDGVDRQMFYCTKGKHRFSETSYYRLFCKHGRFKEYEQLCKLSCYGLSVDAIVNVLGKDPRAIGIWQQSVSKKTSLLHDVICLSIPLAMMFIQMDELWSYLKNKNHPKCFVKGSEADFKGKTQNTSYIERLNLTLRQHVPFLQRKTLGYCKKANFTGSLWINL